MEDESHAARSLVLFSIVYLESGRAWSVLKKIIGPWHRVLALRARQKDENGHGGLARRRPAIAIHALRAES